MSSLPLCPGYRDAMLLPQAAVILKLFQFCEICIIFIKCNLSTFLYSKRYRLLSDEYIIHLIKII